MRVVRLRFSAGFARNYAVRRASARYADLVRLVARPDRPLLFIGDLDPTDLAVYATLLAGGLSESRPSATGINTQYFGVGDVWLALCEAERLDKRSLPTIEMTPYECALLAAVECMPIALNACVGERAMDLLRSGKKLELEGASNPAFYSPAFPAKLRGLLFG